MREPKPEEIKELTINGVVYAKYHMDRNVLFLKVVKKIVPNSWKDSEDFISTIIGIVEQKEFESLSYLNIK